MLEQLREVNAVLDDAIATERGYLLKPVEWLRPHPDNPRMITDDDVRKLAQSMEQLGFLDPIECREDGEILSGHRRWLAAKHLNLKRVRVVIHSGLSDAEAAAYRIAANKMSEDVKWNRPMLADQLSGMSDFIAPDLLGFSEKDIVQLFDLDRAFQEDDQQPEGAESEETLPGPFVRQGETWHFVTKGGDTLAILSAWSDRPDSLRKVEELVLKMQKWLKTKATLDGPDGPTFEATIAERAMGSGEML